MTTHHHEQPVERAWRDRAECRNGDPELFFPAGTAGPAHDAQVAAAKAVCARCSVQPACLAEALARIPYGIAGGLTEHERAALRGAHPPRPPAPAPAMRGETDEALIDGPRAGLTPRQRVRIGRELLRVGRPHRQVARACGVSARTVERWAGDATAAGTSTTSSRTRVGEGSHGGHRAPLGPPTPSTPRQGHEQRKDTDPR